MFRFKPSKKRRRASVSMQVVPARSFPRFRGRRATMGEEKFFDTTLGNTNVTTAGVITNPSLTLIPQGVTESTRVGRKCVIKSLHLRGMVTLRQSSNGAQCADRFRIIIYLDKQTNGNPAVVTDILETATIDSFRNLANSQRFTVLHDATFAMNPTAAEGNAAVNICERIYHLNLNRNLNFPLEFSGTTGVIGELRSNNIGILCIASETVINVSQVRYTTRVRFLDN